MYQRIHSQEEIMGVTAIKRVHNLVPAPTTVTVAKYDGEGTLLGVRHQFTRSEDWACDWWIPWTWNAALFRTKHITVEIGGAAPAVFYLWQQDDGIWVSNTWISTDAA